MRERINPLRPGNDYAVLGDHFLQHIFGIYIQRIIICSRDVVDVLFDKIDQFCLRYEVLPPAEGSHSDDAEQLFFAAGRQVAIDLLSLYPAGAVPFFEQGLDCLLIQFRPVGLEIEMLIVGNAE